MSQDDRPSALRRKAGAGRAPPEFGQPSLDRVMRLALAQAAEGVAGLALVAGPLDDRRTTLADMVGKLSETTLMALLEGPDSRFGLAVLDSDLMAALIEVQTTGRVVPRPAEPRVPTRTDAVICADMIDRLLEILEDKSASARLPDGAGLSGYRFAMALAEPRTVSLTLADLPYRQLSVPVDLGGGAKSGRIDLMLPADTPGAAQAAGRDTGFSDAMAVQVMSSGATLAATLCRIEMTLAELTALAPGQVIAIPARALTEVAIEDLGGTMVGRGRLGQSGGNRAVRLTLDPGETKQLTPPASQHPADPVPQPPDVA